MFTHVLGVNVTCTAEALTVRIQMEQPFQGLLYARGFPLECRGQGTGDTDVTLHLPATRCGVRVLPNKVSSHVYHQKQFRAETGQVHSPHACHPGHLTYLWVRTCLV